MAGSREAACGYAFGLSLCVLIIFMLEMIIKLEGVKICDG